MFLAVEFLFVFKIRGFGLWVQFWQVSVNDEVDQIYNSILNFSDDYFGGVFYDVGLEISRNQKILLFDKFFENYGSFDRRTKNRCFCYFSLIGDGIFVPYKNKLFQIETDRQTLSDIIWSFDHSMDEETLELLEKKALATDDFDLVFECIDAIGTFLVYSDNKKPLISIRNRMAAIGNKEITDRIDRFLGSVS